MKVFVIEANGKVWNQINHWSGEHPDIYPTREKAEKIINKKWSAARYYAENSDSEIKARQIKIVEYELIKI